MNVVGYENVKVRRELMVGISKGVATNGNGLGVELEPKNFKARPSKIKVVVCVKKMAHL